jgi:hypothetical protein
VTLLNPCTVLVVTVVVYGLLLRGTLWLVRRQWGNGTAQALWDSVKLGLLLFVVAVPLFWLVAKFLRSGGLLSGAQSELARSGMLVQWARVAFFALYGALLLTSGAVGYRLAHRLGSPPLAMAAASGVAMLVLLLATLLYVEAFNACIVGSAFIFQDFRC